MTTHQHHIEAVGNAIIFKFVEDVTSTRFINSSESGFIINSIDGNQMMYPRWGEVLHVGSLVTEVKKGEFILIDPGKWTAGFHMDTDRYWKTDDTHVIGVADTPGNTY
jgi:hypothetical protein